MLQDLLTIIHNTKIQEKPFPHICIENFLEEEKFEYLKATFPLTCKFPDTKLEADRISSNYIFQHPHEFDLEWLNLFLTLNSLRFVDAILKIFGLTEYGTGTISVRELLDRNTDLVTDCQFVINRGKNESKNWLVNPHVDNPKELYAGLLYFTGEKDYENGGNVHLFEKTKKTIFYGKNRVAEACISSSECIKCKPNTLVIFPNTKDSIHAVSAINGYTRKYINFITEWYEPTFQIK